MMFELHRQSSEFPTPFWLSDESKRKTGRRKGDKKAFSLLDLLLPAKGNRWGSKTKASCRFQTFLSIHPAIDFQFP